MAIPVQTIELGDGRRLAYAEHGDPRGTPVLFCHGWLASGLTRHPDDALTASLGVRLVTVDRPGIGRSDPDRATTLLAAAADLAALADHLGLDRFGVLGHSGGGPYALACAFLLPERVERVAIACGFAPFDRPNAYAGMTARMRGWARLLRRAPWLAGPSLGGAPKRFRRDPDKAFAKQFGHLCAADEAALEDPQLRAVLLAAAVESLAAGSAAVARESQLLFAAPWGFDPSSVRCHVDLWYGEVDTIVPVEMGSYLARTIPDSHLTVLPGEGHTLLFTRWADILRELSA